MYKKEKSDFLRKRTRRRNRGFDPGRIWMVDMKNKFYGEHDHG